MRFLRARNVLPAFTQVLLENDQTGDVGLLLLFSMPLLVFSVCIAYPEVCFLGPIVVTQKGTTMNLDINMAQ